MQFVWFYFPPIWAKKSHHQRPSSKLFCEKWFIKTWIGGYSSISWICGAAAQIYICNLYFSRVELVNCAMREKGRALQNNTGNKYGEDFLMCCSHWLHTTTIINGLICNQIARLVNFLLMNQSNRLVNQSDDSSPQWFGLTHSFTEPQVEHIYNPIMHFHSDCPLNPKHFLSM